jgi:hypothetical protein
VRRSVAGKGARSIASSLLADELAAQEPRYEIHSPPDHEIDETRVENRVLLPYPAGTEALEEEALPFEIHICEGRIRRH